MATLDAISQRVWEMKYRLKGPGGEAVDKTVADTWRRVAWALAEPEKDRAAWTDKFYSALENFAFLRSEERRVGKECRL